MDKDWGPWDCVIVLASRRTTFCYNNILGPAHTFNPEVETVKYAYTGAVWGPSSLRTYELTQNTRQQDLAPTIPAHHRVGN